MATPVIMPKFEMSQETATVIEWLKQEGESVAKGDLLLSVETDKVTMEVESPAAGVLAGVRVAPQEVVPVTEVIAYILQEGEELPSAPPTLAPDAGTPFISENSHSDGTPFISENSHSDGTPSAKRGAGDVPAGRATPVAQRLAASAGVDLGAVQGTGPRGKITKSDVVAAAFDARPDRMRATPAARRIARDQGVALADVAGSGPRGRVQAADVRAFAPTPSLAASAGVIPLAGMRRTIAERMTASYRTAPHITLTVRVDMGEFQKARAQLNARAEAMGQTRASVTALLVRAVGWALKRHPLLNSTLVGEEIHLLPEVNVGVAVAISDGLIVPVVRGADRKGIGEIAAEVQDLTVRAREGRLAPSDVSDGTFTISNLGPFGIEQFTAIINPPQAGILAVGATQVEAVIDGEGRVVARPIMRMTLSADHRIVDGAVGARFLADLREGLEGPALLLW